MRKIHYSKIKVSRLGVLYVLSMLYAELFQAGIIGGYYLTVYIIALFWILLWMFTYMSFGGQKRFFQVDIKAIGLILFPWIIFILYNIIIYVCGIGYTPFIKSSFVQITWTPIIIFGAVGSYFIFGKNALRYFLYSIYLSYVITIIINLISMGPTSFISGLLTIFSGNSVGNPFESNSDMVFALGLLGIFYFDIFIKERKEYRNHGIVIMILVILGGKRIEWLALAGILLASFVTKTIAEPKRNVFQNLISVFILLGNITFIYLVVNGFMSAYIYGHGINSMGRMRMWDYISQYASFSIDYLGRGYSFSNLMLEQARVHTYMGHVYTLHSDVLKIFVDLGFWMFIFWNIYYLFMFPSKVRKCYGYKVSNMVWFLVVFLFIIYLTDNAINYFITQTTFCYLLFEAIRLGNLPCSSAKDDSIF